MDTNIRTGHFTSDGGDVNIPLGFIPDYIKLVEISGGATGTVIIEWFRMQEQDQASGQQEGFTIKEGITDECADGQGIIAYDESGDAPTITGWTQAVGSGASARTNTTDGTFIKPVAAVGSVPADREAIYECISAGTSGATEPVWNKGIGQTTVDGTTVWEAVREPLRRSGYKGFKFYGQEQTDGDEYYYFALQSSENVNHGDVDGWPSGVENG